MDKLVETQFPFWCGSEVAGMLALSLDTICTYAKRYEIGVKRGGIWWFQQADINTIKARMLPKKEDE